MEINVLVGIDVGERLAFLVLGAGDEATVPEPDAEAA